MQFMITAYDGTDSDAFARRMSVRPRHLENMLKVMEQYKVLCAGGITNDKGTPIGSFLIMDFPSRELLDKYLEAVGIDREDVYIANILKCRPPKNRDPLPEEEDACIGYLREQVKLIRPKIIACLGRVSAKRLIKEDFKITEEHGVWFERGEYTMCAVFHPAALLRDPRKKEAMLLDMQKIKEKLEEE